jgi:probable F420-dependent oxidoreductase
MNLTTLGVFCFLDPLPGAALGPFAQRVEELGYSTLWFAEGLGRESLSLAPHLLDRTQDLVIATGIAVAFSREPIAAANAARTLAELFPDRFVLGLGVSNAAANARRGVRYEKPVAFMREYLARMRAAPYGAPAPPQDPPIVLGSLHPQMLRLAAAETAGVLTYFTPPEKTATARATIGSDKWLCVEQAVLLEQDAARARAAARQYMASYLQIPHYSKMLGPLGFGDSDLAGRGSDRLVDAIVAWGSAEAIQTRIAAHYAAGATHVCILPLRMDGDRAPDMGALEALAPSRAPAARR